MDDRGDNKNDAGAEGSRPEPIPGTPTRREMLKVITSVPAAALVPIAPALAEQLKQTHTHPAPAPERAARGPYQPKVLNAHEWKTIHVLSDLIIPADERSVSATQAGVPEFIDDSLELSKEQENSEISLRFTLGGGRLLPEIRGGLTWLDMICNRQFGRDFVDCSDAQQKQILDRIAYPKQAAPEDAPGVAFFTQLRNLVVTGFFSSKMGVEDLPYLGNTIVADWQGCPPNVLAKLGLHKEVGGGD